MGSSKDYQNVCGMENQSGQLYFEQSGVTPTRRTKALRRVSALANPHRQAACLGTASHDMGLTHQYSSAHERFEVDGANAARDFLRRHGIATGYRHCLDGSGTHEAKQPLRRPNF
jgi:hypothetical protein